MKTMFAGLAAVLAVVLMLAGDAARAQDAPKEAPKKEAPKKDRPRGGTPARTGVST